LSKAKSAAQGQCHQDLKQVFGIPRLGSQKSHFFSNNRNVSRLGLMKFTILFRKSRLVSI
jgi:hypothetical protein